MNSLWNDEESLQYPGDLGLRVYTSRLLGRDRSLVLHGGGNTSVKLRCRDVLGCESDVLYVKGSGWDLATIEAEGFSPVRLDHLRALAELPRLSDVDMVDELLTHRTRASAPTPSVEAILHAILPHKFVDHTHADAVVTVTNTPDGEARIREIYGDDVLVIPYVMPGFDLARLCAQRFAASAHAGTIGMVLLHHGIFSFGDTARESYERMIALVDRAERYLQRQGAWEPPRPSSRSGEAPRAKAPVSGIAPARVAQLRSDISRSAGFPLVMTRRASREIEAFVARPDLAVVSQQGPATPDHVLRTKRLPMLGRDVPSYARRYAESFAAYESGAAERKTMLDPAPRVVLDPELGLLALGRGAGDAAAAAELYEHTIGIIERAQVLGGYRALPERAIFEVEYWDLEQAKLRRAGKPAAFAGEIALVTGAASGIGKACVDALLARGASVVGLDLDPGVSARTPRVDYRGIVCDVTSESDLRAALAETADAYGGLDMLICNAGIFPGARRIADLPEETWRQVMRVNLDANLNLMREAHPLLRCAPRGGRVVVVGSKNVPAPGPGAAAYSASKAALTQLARVAALEWGADGIRINTVHPNAVFDTAIWTPEVLAVRAQQYGMSVEAYKKNNVLGVDVASRDVAELAAELCGPVFAKTTGAQIPVDGGNDRVI